MPIYEANGYRSRSRSHLTKAQKQEAEAALYGLRPTPSMSTTPTISAEDIERMRALVTQSDIDNSRENKEFDLNDPKTPRYVHQPYPTTVYHHARRASRAAKNPAELAEALKNGWEMAPYPSEIPAEIELDPETQAEIDALTAKAKAKADAAAKAKRK